MAAGLGLTDMSRSPRIAVPVCFLFHKKHLSKDFFASRSATALFACLCAAGSHLAPNMGKPEGATNKGFTRAKLLDLIKKAGLDLATLCKMEGEIVAQPTKQFLERIVDRYPLAGPINLTACKKNPGTPMSLGVKKFFPSTGEGSSKDTPCPEITRLAEVEIPETDEANAASEEDAEENLIIQPNQVYFIAST